MLTFGDDIKNKIFGARANPVALWSKTKYVLPEKCVLYEVQSNFR